MNVIYNLSSQSVVAYLKNITFIGGLPQAGRFVYIKLVKYLADNFYLYTGHTPGLFFTSHNQ